MRGVFFFFFLFLPYLIFSQDKGDAIIIGSIGSPRILIPILASDSASAEVCSFIFNGLLKYDEDLNLVGDLAQSWEIQEEGKVIIFYLRKGVFWHDGGEFTAEDVEFTYKKLIDSSVPTPYSGDFERIKNLEILDKYTVKIIYKEPFAPALSSWTMGIIPKHILEKEKNLLTSRFSRNPIGTGPYKFKKWIPQQKIELVVNENYFEKRPNIDRVIFRIVPDTATLFLEILAEGVDNAGLSPLQFLRHTNSPQFKKNYIKFRYPSNSFLYLGYNLTHPLFKDKRVREALNYAVNKEEIIKAVLLGEGEVSKGPFTPESWAYDSGFKAWDFSPQKAKMLLSEVGFEDKDGDGILEKRGKPFKFTIITNQGNLERQKVAEIIQAQLKDIGVKVEIKVVEWSVFIDEVIRKRKFEAVLLGWSLSRDPDIYDIFHSSKTAPSEFNFVGYNNKEVDRLLVEARRIFDRERRKKLYYKINKLIYEDQPYMFLYVPNSLSCLHKRFRGIKPAKAGYWYNFIDWWVPLKEQRYRIKLEG